MDSLVCRDPIICTGVDGVPCGFKADSWTWTQHARTHNPSAYRKGWPCECRPAKPCPKHANADWFRAG